MSTNLPSIGDVVMSPVDVFMENDEPKYDQLLCNAARINETEHYELWKATDPLVYDYVEIRSVSRGEDSASSGIIWDGGRYCISDLDNKVYSYDENFNYTGVIIDATDLTEDVVHDVAYIPSTDQYILVSTTNRKLYYYTRLGVFVKEVDISENTEGSDGLCYDGTTGYITVSGDGSVSTFTLDGIWVEGSKVDITDYTSDCPAITVDEDYFYVVARDNNEVLRFNKSWMYVDSVLSLEDSNTSGITIRGKHLVLVGRTNDSIVELALDSFTYTVGERNEVTNLSSGWGCYVKEDGSFVIGDTGAEKVFMYDSEGDLLDTIDITSQDTQSRGLTQLADGRWLLAGSSNETLYLYDQDFLYSGESYYIGDLDTQIQGVSEAPDGSIWFIGTEFSKIYKLSSDFIYTGVYINIDSGSSYSGLSVDPLGGIFWAINYTTGFCEGYSLEGEITEISDLGTQGTNARGCNMLADGTLRWLSKDASRVYIFRPVIRRPLIDSVTQDVPYRLIADYTGE